MYRQKFVIIILILCTFISCNSQSEKLTKQKCIDRIEQFKQSENILRLYLKDLRDDFNNFENSVQNIVNNAKINVEKTGGNVQAKSYKEFDTLKENLNSKIRAFETILNEHIFSILMIEDCYFNRLISRERYETLFQLNQSIKP